MKYVFLASWDEKQLDAMSAGERAMFEEACSASEQNLKRGGHLYAVEDHENHSIAVQLVSGKVTFTDGPFVSTKGPSVQLFFIHARDLNAAIQIASQMPQARLGVVEVRPIVDFGPANVS